MRLLIDGLPRTGTTTLARMFAVHPQTRVIIEPFHPRRYDGQFHRELFTGVGAPFDAAWNRWNVIKHVWEPEGEWPFGRRPSLKNELWRSATAIIAVDRRNLAKRYVSAQLSRTLRFWIGSRQEFLGRLQQVSLLPFDIPASIAAVRRDRDALQTRAQQLAADGLAVIAWTFEDFFGGSTEAQIGALLSLFREIGLDPLPREWLRRKAGTWLDPDQYRWSSMEVYRRIPNHLELDAAFRSEGFGSFLTDPTASIGAVPEAEHA